MRTPIPIPQIRVLRALYEADGPLTRTDLAEVIGTKTQVLVGRAVGYSDPEKRAAFEASRAGGGKPGKPCKSLLTRGYVREERLVGDVTELVIYLTPEGRKRVENLGYIKLPPVKS